MPKLKFSFSFFKRLPSREKRLTLPTFFTLLRIALTPFVVGALVYHAWAVAGVLFVCAALTDLLDGELARLRGEKTFLGACLDPLADKILVLSCFLALSMVEVPLLVIPRWFFAIIFFKELLLLIGVVGVYLFKGEVEIRPTFMGKVTMMLQVFFISWLCACYVFGWAPLKTYYVFGGLVLISVFASLCDYVRVGVRFLRRVTA